MSSLSDFFLIKSRLPALPLHYVWYWTCFSIASSRFVVRMVFEWNIYMGIKCVPWSPCKYDDKKKLVWFVSSMSVKCQFLCKTLWVWTPFARWLTHSLHTSQPKPCLSQELNSTRSQRHSQSLERKQRLSIIAVSLLFVHMWFWFCHEAKCFLWRLWSAAEFPVLPGVACLLLSSLTSSNMEDDPCSKGLYPLSKINPQLKQRRSLLKWVMDRSWSQCISLRFNR